MEDYNKNDYRLFKPMPRWLRTGIAIFSILIVFWIGISAFGSKTPEAPTLPVNEIVSFQVSPVIVAMGARIGLSESQLVEVHAQIADNYDICGATSLGCYVDDTETLYMEAATLSDPDALTVMAHEYYHFVWYRKLNDAGRKIKGDSLMIIYSRSDQLGEDFQWRMKPYIDDGYELGSLRFQSELQSIWCTEIADNRLSTSSLNWCSQWIPVRNALHNSIY